MKIITKNTYYDMQDRNKYTENYPLRKERQSEEKFEEYLRNSCKQLSETIDNRRMQMNYKTKVLMKNQIQYHQRWI